MNTSTKYIKEIRYREARCCLVCEHFREPNGKSHDVKYCWLHDNPINSHAICKYFKRK